MDAAWSHPVFKTQAEFEARVAELEAEESAKPIRWHWLSFADDTGFLGVVIIRTRGITTALNAINRLGINPGGSVKCLPFEPPANFDEKALAERLLSERELLVAGLLDED